MNIEKKSAVIVDVGSRFGCSPIWEKSKLPIQYFGFEPDAEECARLNARVRKNGDANVLSVHYPVALTKTTGVKAHLYIYDDARLSSQLKPNMQLLQQFPIEKLLKKDAFNIVEEVDLTGMSLDEFCKKHELDSIDYLKIDTQGSELDILQGGSQILADTFCVCIEVEFQELYVGQPLFRDVDKYMASQGFELLNLQNHFWKRDVPSNINSRGQIIFADALYVRSMLNESNSVYWNRVSGSDDRMKRVVNVCEVLGYEDLGYQISAKSTMHTKTAGMEKTVSRSTLSGQKEATKVRWLLYSGALKRINRLLIFVKINVAKSLVRKMIKENYYYCDSVVKDDRI